MTREEVISRLRRIADHAVHTFGEKPLVLSLDDGIAINEAISALQQPEIIHCRDCTKWKRHYTDGARFRCDLTDSEDFCSWAERREK